MPAKESQNSLPQTAHTLVAGRVPVRNIIVVGLRGNTTFQSSYQSDAQMQAAIALDPTITEITNVYVI